MHKFTPRLNLGQQPFSTPLRAQLAALIMKREPDEQVIVHHYTDTRTHIQLEYERRSSVYGIAFGREIIPST